MRELGKQENQERLKRTMFTSLTLPVGGLQPALPALATDRVRGALQVHVRAMRALQDNMMRYQWHATEHGWGSLLAYQHRELESWIERLVLHLDAAGLAMEVQARRSVPVPTEEDELPADGLALAARMMTDFETLEHQLGEIWVLAEDMAAEWMYDVLMGLGFVYHKAASLYRQHLCASVVAAWEGAEAGQDSDRL